MNRFVLIILIALSRLSWASCIAGSSSSVETPSDHLATRHAGYKYFQAGQYEEALSCYRDALQMTESTAHSSLGVLANDLNDIAVLFEEMGRHAEAMAYYQRELGVLDKLGAKAGVLVAQTHTEMGGLALVGGLLPTAETEYKKAIALLKHDGQSENPELAKALAGLGRVYGEWGRYGQATALLRRARAIAEKSLPANSPALVSLMDSEASLLTDAGRFAEAERCWLEALKISEQAYGSEGIMYSAILLHLGQLYSEIKDYKSAEKMLERGLAAERKMTGVDDMDRTIMTSALADVYRKDHKDAQAEPLFEESARRLAHCENLPLACAAVRTYLGEHYMAKGQFTAAEAEYERALKIREDSLGEHPLVASSLGALSQAMRKLGKKKEAKLCQQRAEKIMSLPGNALYKDENTVDITAFRASKP